jgi:hypothetical protein
VLAWLVRLLSHSVLGVHITAEIYKTFHPLFIVFTRFKAFPLK